MKKKVLIFIVLIVVGGVAAFLLLGAKKTTETVKLPTYFTYQPGDYFITNVKDSKALLKTTIVLELEEKDREKQDTFLADNEQIIREVIVFALSDKTEEQLRSSGIHEELRAELIRKISEKLGMDYLHTIYFSDYVLQ